MPAGRSLVVAVGGAVLLELIASVVHQWPFGMQRVSVFLLPLLLHPDGRRGRSSWPSLSCRYVPRRLAWWRIAALGIGAVVLAAAAAPLGFARLPHPCAQTSPAPGPQPPHGLGLPGGRGGDRPLSQRRATSSSSGPTRPGTATRAAVLHQRLPRLQQQILGERGDGRGEAGCGHPLRPTQPVVSMTPSVRTRAAGPCSAEAGKRCIAAETRCSRLRPVGYCTTRKFSYPDTGRLTMLTRSACAAAGLRRRTVDPEPLVAGGPMGPLHG